MEPTLNRVIKVDEDHEKLIAKHLENFKYDTRGRRGNNLKELTEDEWWSLGQHHVLSTPLLDWTNSPYVAAFFALSEDFECSEDNYCAVYAIRKRQVEINNKKLKDKKFVVYYI